MKMVNFIHTDHLSQTVSLSQRQYGAQMPNQFNLILPLFHPLGENAAYCLKQCLNKNSQGCGCLGVVVLPSSRLLCSLLLSLESTVKNIKALLMTSLQLQ